MTRDDMIMMLLPTTTAILGTLYYIYIYNISDRSHVYFETMSVLIFEVQLCVSGFMT